MVMIGSTPPTFFVRFVFWGEKKVDESDETLPMTFPLRRDGCCNEI